MNTSNLSSATILTNQAGDTLSHFFPNVTPPIMVCSLAGATLYILSRSNYELWKQILLALISFLGGIYSAELSAVIIEGVINSLLQKMGASAIVVVPHPVGALLSSTLCVTALLKFMSRIKQSP